MYPSSILNTPLAEQPRPEGTFLLPFLAAWHIREPVLGNVAILALQSAIAAGCLQGDEEVAKQHVLMISEHIAEACSNNSEPNFQTSALSLMKTISKKYYNLLTVDAIINFVTASFFCTVNPRPFLEALVDASTRKRFDAEHAAMQRPSVSEEKENSFLRDVIKNLATNVLHVGVTRVMMTRLPMPS